MSPPEKSEVLAAVRDLFALWDAAQARDRATWPSVFSCPAKCSKCCERSPAIPVSPGEALVLAEAVRALPEPLQARVRERVHELASRVETDRVNAPTATYDPDGPLRPGLEGACPLLEDNLCTVYESRPILCRAYGYAAETGGVYFGCEILVETLKTVDAVHLPDYEAALRAVPFLKVFDTQGRVLPDHGMLSELVDRLLQ
jgi:Fe-S-cluster containining protein